jgi:MFS family permease
MLFRLSLALFAMQAGFHGFTASLPLALARSGVVDSEIGLIVGVAALIQVPAAFVGGALVDRFGGLRLLGVGAVAYLVGAGVLLLPGVDAAVDRLPFIVARISQGIGIALTLPAALSLVPRLLPGERRGFGLAFVGSAHTLTLVALPPLSLAILGTDRSLATVTLVVAAFVVVGAGMLVLFPLRLRPPDAPLPVGRLRFSFRRAWIPPLLVTLLYVSHWGVVTAYLPQRAEFAGADVGLFFAADGLAVLVFRIPSGWLADRVQPRWLVLVGLSLTAVAIALLVLPPTTPILVAAGALTGAGAGLVLTPLLVEMSRRSTDADRGSAFAMLSASLAAALVLGSIGAAPIIASAGFEATILASIGGLVVATLVALVDPKLGSRDALVAAPAGD